MPNINLTQLPPLSLYIHIPWCVKKCPYCDFNSHATKNNEIPEEQYIDALIRDAESTLPLIWGRQIQTIFIGGGTPSLFSGKAIDRLITNLRMLYNLSPYTEITMEANPGTVEQQYIAEYRDAGVNRISLGVQSFNDVQLKNLGRIHNSHETDLAIKKVKDCFDNFNLDIIYGLPNQSIEDAVYDIQRAIDYQPTHISAYNLTIEPNTEFAKRTPKGIPDDDICFQMQDEIIETLENNGYERYETSAYCKKGFNARHNLNYWEFGDYLGIGAGAHGKISFHDRIIRQMRHKHPAKYMESILTGQHIQTSNEIATKDLPFEFMMNALRLTGGFKTTLFTETTGQAFSQIIPQLLQAQQTGYILLDGNSVIPTTKGKDFLNNLLETFL
ncbi:MAG: radical SAM family heme chaperone HemW [Burkholderiales bacterium]|nr:radical SAM family heme chaperone HemW [Burkholderiales bacterium]